MTCCLENAVLDALRALNCTPIKSENHFVDRRQCTDCLPYLVVRTGMTAGLRTSSAVQKLNTVEIKAYFADKKRHDARDLRDLIWDWLMFAGCASLGACGCFCVQGAPTLTIQESAGNTVVLTVSFRGLYKQTDESTSESV
jgi:hypothetical protein